MKIKRFHGPDVRGVLQQVREALGPDAVILSNRRENSGVEVVAAADYDEAGVWQALASAEASDRPAPPARFMEPWQSERAQRRRSACNRCRRN